MVMPQTVTTDPDAVLIPLGMSVLYYELFGGRSAYDKSSLSSHGGPCGDRTHDTRIKSPVLYQAELTARAVPRSGPGIGG